MIEASEPDCECEHAAHWHPRRSTAIVTRISRTGCVAKIKNDRGYPVACRCRSYRPQKEVRA